MALKLETRVKTGKLVGGTVVLDLIAQEYHTSQGDGGCAQRIIAFKNPDYIMIVLTNAFDLDDGSPMELKTAQQYDKEFREEILESEGFHDERIRLEGQLYRKIMSCYRDEGDILSESDMERTIAELKRISHEEFDATEKARKAYDKKLREVSLGKMSAESVEREWRANIDKICDKYAAEKEKVRQTLGVSKKDS